ncbi:DUF7118 family protein [Halanaeroarchaeum sulfurireducens]|uniref:Uncharacterized protein n=1 Tax=Halanaeroarchaeum sulfurireducens TaxID=1604004 RepID=A0A0F7P7I3_9EURY|nr:hypothetical protein [Halanaeroarchaeum sulfurireducens]AKH96642.1 hypothetical protein HLASF_0128 [Halanaeroarchaeum sulfurireducens]
MSTESLVDRLASARADLEAAEAAVDDVGEDRLERLRAAREDLLSLLGQYESRATGSGDFQAYLDFQEAVAEFVEDLPEDLPEREAFEEINDRFEKRRLTEGDFEAARDALSPVDALVDRLDDRSDAHQQYRAARRDVESRLREIEEEIDRLERVASLADADLDAPVEKLREPMMAYNEAVADAFDSFKRDAPAREVLAFVEATRSFPLASYPEPPAELADYLSEADVGAEPVQTLLEFADYSRSKLDHYVDHPQQFMRLVGGNRTYLDRLDAEPLEFEWPPAPADEVRWRADELVSVVNRFASDDVVERLERVQALARNEPHYEHLRLTTRAREELTDEERERVAAGAVGADIEALEAERDRLTEALDEY